MVGFLRTMTGNMLMDPSTENQTKTLLTLLQLLQSPETAKGKEEEEEEVLFRLSTSFRTFHVRMPQNGEAFLLSSSLLPPLTPRSSALTHG